MSPQRQKGKHRKRPRGWHRGPLEDQRFAAAVQKLDGCPDRDTPETCPHCGVKQFNNPDADPALDAIAHLCWKCVKPLNPTEGQQQS